MDGHGGPRGRRRALAVACLAWYLAAPPLAARADPQAPPAPPTPAAPAVPAGYRLEADDRVGAGVEHVRLRRDIDPEVVHVARVRRSEDLALRVVLAGDHLGAVERTDAMCQRVDCLVAVNADFYQPEPGEPIGGVVIDGQLLRSPVPTHHQLTIAPDGSLAAGVLETDARLVASDLGETRIDGVNVERLDDQLVLYTRAHGPSTRTNAYGAELTARIVEPAPPLRLGQTALVELLSFDEGRGDAPIPADGLVLSGHGAGARRLADLWARVAAGEVGGRGLLRLDVTPAAAQSTGGSPVLVREGRRWVGDDGSGFVHDRHPRTMVGWTADGEVLLVTVDGRQPGYSAGLTLPEAAELMLGLGAVEALNMDGGGSTTFVVGGQVVNQPSDRLVRRGGKEEIVHVPERGDTVVASVQRPVAVGLAVVRRTPAAPARDDALDRASPALPVQVPLPAPSRDPGSVPGGSLPAVVATLPGPARTGLRLALVAALSGGVTALVTATALRLRWRRRLVHL